MSSNVVRVIVTLEILYGLVVCVAYLVRYLTKSNWRATAIGRNSAYFVAILGFLFARTLSGRIFGPIGDYVWIGGFLVLDWILHWRLVILIHSQRGEARPRTKSKDLP